MERSKVLTHVLPFGLAFMLAVAIAPEVRADPPSINAIATNTQPLSDSDRRAVERYTTFWTDVLKRAAEAPEGVGVNVLVSPDVSDLGEGNVLYSTRVDLRRTAGPAPAAAPVSPPTPRPRRTR